MANILIIGCGAVGMALARRLNQQGHQVTGIKRNVPSNSNGINLVACDIGSAESVVRLPTFSVDVVFFIVSADNRTEESYRVLYVTGLENMLAKYNHLPWFFVSSTSVYGQTQGEWVDEDSQAAPALATSMLIRQAEQRVLTANAYNCIVRFSGIYGPGREHLVRMARQTPLVQQQPPSFTNRIHQDDCVAVLDFLLSRRLAGTPLASCYLASDDDPAPLWEVVSWLAGQMQCPPPQAATVETNANQNKRCNSQRLKSLGYQFKYPSYRDGYAELIAHG